MIFFFFYGCDFDVFSALLFSCCFSPSSHGHAPFCSQAIFSHNSAHGGGSLIWVTRLFCDSFLGAESGRLQCECVALCCVSCVLEPVYPLLTTLYSLGSCTMSLNLSLSFQRYQSTSHRIEMTTIQEEKGQKINKS